MPIRSSRCASTTARSCGRSRSSKHDVWDYDVPAQPTLALIDVGGAAARRRDPGDQARLRVRARPRHRTSRCSRSRGAPCRRAAHPGEVLSATQTFPADLPALVPCAHSVLRRPTASRRSIAARAANAFWRSGTKAYITPPTNTGNAAIPVHGWRRQLGRRRRRPSRCRVRRHEPGDACDHADTGGRHRCRTRGQPGQGNQPAERRTVRNAPRFRRVAVRRAVQPASLGRACRARPAHQAHRVGGAARHHRRSDAARRRPENRHAELCGPVATRGGSSSSARRSTAIGVRSTRTAARSSEICDFPPPLPPRR